MGQADLGPAGPEAYGEPGRTAYPDPDPAPFGEPRRDLGAGTDWDGPAADQGDGGWRSAGVDTPTGTWSPEEPVGREPDYPALFGELYRRSAAQQDPIWEEAPDQPLPEPGQPDPAPSAWPFEETTQSWEPSDRSFVWPSDELPSTSAEWDTPAPRSWLDDPDPRPAAARRPGPGTSSSRPRATTGAGPDGRLGRRGPARVPLAGSGPGPAGATRAGPGPGREVLGVGGSAGHRQRGPAVGGRATAGRLGLGHPDRHPGGQEGG